MEKYIQAMQNLHWLPFIGMTAGKSPLATRFVEAGILAFVPLIVMGIWAIPKLEAKIDSSSQLRAVETMAYAKSLDRLSEKQEESNMKLNSAMTSIAIIKNNLSQIEKKVDSIDDIANSKVRSVEGRLDSLERSIK